MSQLAPAANFEAVRGQKDGLEVIHLRDNGRGMVASIAPSVGNLAYEFSVHGKNVYWMPSDDLREIRNKHMLGGNPFLAPWANRLEEDGFYANGQHYRLNPDLGNIRRDGNQKPIHGLLAFTDRWKVVEAKADGKAAWVTSRLDFAQYPDLMAQFPFAHVLEMTYRLSEGRLEVRTKIENKSTQPMPVAIGFHPYFQLHDSPRDDWKVHVAATRHMTLNQQIIPTGESTPVDLPDPVALQGTQLDDVFSGLVRGSDGRADFWVQGKQQKLSVLYGPKFPIAVVYSPKGRDFICFEPMAAITNAFALAHRGAWDGLQSVPAGGTWQESYWVAPSGF